MTNTNEVTAQPNVPVPLVFDHEVKAACRAMWASWGRMRPDHERKHWSDMRKALEAAALARAQAVQS